MHRLNLDFHLDVLFMIVIKQLNRLIILNNDNVNLLNLSIFVTAKCSVFQSNKIATINATLCAFYIILNVFLNEKVAFYDNFYYKRYISTIFTICNRYLILYKDRHMTRYQITLPMNSFFAILILKLF